MFEKGKHMKKLLSPFKVRYVLHLDISWASVCQILFQCWSYVTEPNMLSTELTF